MLVSLGGGRDLKARIRARAGPQGAALSEGPTRPVPRLLHFHEDSCLCYSLGFVFLCLLEVTFKASEVGLETGQVGTEGA